MSRFIVFALAACFVSTQFAFGATTLIPMNSSWKHFKGTTEASTPMNAWRALAFNDATWITSTAPFFYGEPLSGTPLNDMNGSYSCVFMRKKFTVADPAELQGLRLDVRIDDGFVAWINGTEVLRYNVPGGELARTALASGAIEPETRSIAISNLTSLLFAGENVVAVQGFNSGLTGSSDFVLDAALYSFVADNTPPTIVNVSPAAGTVTDLTQISVTFSEPVTGVLDSSFLLNGYPASSFSRQNNTFTFTFPQPPYGPVQVTWFDQHSIADEALFPNRFDHTAPGASWQYNLVDQTAPTLANIFPTPGAAVRVLAQVELTFSEEVVGVNAADLRMNGQPATNSFRILNGPYVFQFPAPAPGTVEITWGSDPGITDLAVPANAFSPFTWSYLLDPNAGRGDLVINEILAANQTGLTDEDGDQHDWIEIHNRGTNTIDVTGWSLSDDPSDPGRWAFGSGGIGPGGYLVVFASGKDRKFPTGTNRMHTSFQLASGGEFLGLYTPDSPRELASGLTPEFPEQRNDHSFGYDSGGVLRYFATPTPGGPNGTSTILSVTEPVHFSVQRGFYSNAFDLYLSSPTLGASIRYTTDGQEPNVSLGTLYSGPLRITNTTMLRAVAYRANFLPSVVGTHSYLFHLTPAQRALPVYNIVMPISNWVGRSGIIGMFPDTGRSEGTAFAVANPATDYHNPSQHGIAWERKGSVEYIIPQDNSGFQIDCGVRVMGSDWQRPRTVPNSKFSFRLYFRGDYGQGRLEYPLFPLSTSQTFDQLVLRAGYNEKINPFIRDEIIRRMSQDMGQVSSVGGLALVLRNGGPHTNDPAAGVLQVYNPCERMHSATLQAKFGGGPEWDVIAPDFATSAEGLGIIDGDRVDFSRLMTNVWVSGALRPLTNDAAYATVARRLELTNFVDYCLLNAYTAMGDWPANNWRAGRERNNTNAIWRFFTWDAEWGMGIYALAVTRDSFGFAGTGTEDAGLNSTVNSEIARLYQALRVNREFRILWADRIHKHFFNGGALTGLNISNRFNELRVQLEPAMGQAIDTEIPLWARDRFPIIMGQFNTYGLYGYSNALYGVFASSNAPAFNQHGGRVGSGFALTMSNPLGGPIYYTLNGDDPRVPFSGAVSNSAVTYSGPVTLNQTVVVKARSLLNGTNWSALAEAEFKVESLLPTLRITEIMYNPIGGGAYEFIELQNYGATAVDLSGMEFNGIDFTFPEPTLLAPGARIVLGSDANPAGFAQRYPGVAVAGRFGGALNNAGETIVLLDRFENTVLSVSYGSAGLWPITANGGGYSLVLADGSGDPDDPLSWRASPAQNGSPGAGDNFPPPPAGVVISEVSAASLPQWIELHNQGGSAVDIAGYSLSDDSQSRKYVLPSMVIGAGQYALIYPSNFFTLNARGDEVLLYNAQTNLLDRTSYGLQVAGYAISRMNGDWTLGNPTPGAANTAAILGSVSGLVINEWLANALTSDDDWLELWNNSAQPVALQGIYLGVSNALFQISSRSYIGPYGFAQLFADEDPGPDHLDFRLPAGGGRLAVYDPTGVEINAVAYGAQAENVAQGRLPNGSGTIQTFPASPSPGASNYVSTYTGPYINEVMARNVSAATNSLGRTADWVELFNPGGSAVDLGGMSLSLDTPEPRQWVFPVGSTVPANGDLVVYCDGDLPASTAATPPLNSGQTLNGDAGGVYLFNAAGQLVNFIEYGFQLENQSIGRIGANWRLLQAFTLGAANGAAATLAGATNIIFNEWMADPADGDDWFELYNAGTQTADLGGLFLTDDPSLAGLTKFRIAPLSFIAAKGWVRFQADGNQGNGFDHVNFALDAGGESVRLYNTNGALLTTVYFGAQAFGVSEGRLPDGAANIARFPGSATPADSNYQLPDNVIISEVLASTSQIELHNPSAQTVNVSGWFLSNTRANYKLHRLPDGTSISAGGYLAITASFGLDTATGGEVILAGADLAGNLNNQRVHVSFGPQDAGVSFGPFATSQGVEFVALAQPTLGVANSSARVGPVVINEIMYNPPPGGSPEYVELLNISSSAVSLAGWTLGNAVNVDLPAMSLGAGEYLVVEILPEQGRLDNAGERINLLRPGGIRVDSVEYDNSAPWPSGPVDGEGLSLQRRNSTTYGNEPLNWLASLPTQGEPNGDGTVPLPVVDVPPQSQTVLPDTPVTLSVGASGGEPLAYRWRLNGVAIPGANAPELVLDYAQVEHAGAYDVLVSNPAGTTLSPAALLTVEAAPQLIGPVADQSVPPNSSVTISVIVRASPPITYQWRLNGVPLQGINSSSFTIPSAELADSGEYSVLVSNPLGSLISAGYVSVLVPATFTLQPVSQTVVEGDEATFRVAATGLPPFTYRWRRQSVNVSNAIGINTPVLTFTNVPLSYNNSQVECILSNNVPPALRSTVVRLFVLADTDKDLLPDTWENTYGLNFNDNSDALLDPDGDGLNNRQEYLAGTNPNDPLSYLRISFSGAPPSVLLSFSAASNKTYSVQYRDELSASPLKLLDVESAPSNRIMQITDPGPGAAARFYQLVTPAAR